MIDLHMHSSASDGSDSIPELLASLQTAGIHTFAVTDHDTIDGALEMEALLTAASDSADSLTSSAVVRDPVCHRAKTADASPPESRSRKKGTAPHMRCVKGIEFSCTTPLRKCHLLGYRYDADDPVFLAAIREGNDLRLAKLEQRLRFLRETYHVEFTEEELAWLYSQKSPGKPHLADLLLKRGIGKSRDDLIRNYLRQADVGSSRILAHTAISGILHAGGIPVWAHPLGGEGERLLTEEEFEAQLQFLIREGIRGLECHYSRYSEEQILFLRAQAKKHDLLISGGSDYHGTRKAIPLGTLNAYGAPVHEEELTILREL
ncbi:MAG: PHP domain-containing protein [Clostridiales bacterium]|nr:PHP domain-containing protein [Clostridiales bacterium]